MGAVPIVHPAMEWSIWEYLRSLKQKVKKASSSSANVSPLLFVIAAAVLWSTGGLSSNGLHFPGWNFPLAVHCWRQSQLQSSPGMKASD